MKITYHALEHDGGVRPETESGVVASWRAGGGPYWVDLASDRPEALSEWLAGLGLDPAVLDELQIGDDSTRVVPLGEAVLFVHPVPPADAGSPGRFTCLCLERLVVTLHGADDPMGAPGQGPTSALRLRQGTTAGVVCALAVLHATRMRRRVLDLHRECDGVAGRMDLEPRTG